MIALDTNVLARLLLQDDAKQFDRARALLASSQEFTAPVTVLLELVWVLESNDCTPAEIQRGIDLLLGLSNFKPPQASTVHLALAAFVQGMDFADALHLGLNQGDEALMTFDKAFVKKASKSKATPTVRLA
ncbi:MAG: type II toxin-antitoxin system VapC family toxin [Rhodoferax sp.]|uniref:type II toxin-antitoxin system VapC family toxin n=1 Tax=Rhodoferax sp. TaxID=50421 RepID=UPI003C73A7E7